MSRVQCPDILTTTNVDEETNLSLKEMILSLCSRSDPAIPLFVAAEPDFQKGDIHNIILVRKVEAEAADVLTNLGAYISHQYGERMLSFFTPAVKEWYSTITWCEKENHPFSQREQEMKSDFRTCRPRSGSTWLSWTPMPHKDRSPPKEVPQLAHPVQLQARKQPTSWMTPAQSPQALAPE